MKNKSKLLCGILFFCLGLFFHLSCSIPGPVDIDLKKMEICFFSTEFQMFCSCFYYLRLVLHMPMYIYWPRFVFLYNFIRSPRAAWIDWEKRGCELCFILALHLKNLLNWINVFSSFLMNKTMEWVDIIRSTILIWTLQVLADD